MVPGTEVVDLLADAHGRQNETSRKRHVQSTEGPVRHWEGSLELAFAGRSAHQNVAQTPLRQISAVRDDVVSWLAEVLEVHTKRVVGMMRAFGSFGRVGPSLFSLRRGSLPLLASMSHEGHVWAMVVVELVARDSFHCSAHSSLRGL